MKKKNITQRKGITLDELAILMKDGFRILLEALELEKRVRKLEDTIIGKNKK